MIKQAYQDFRNYVAPGGAYMFGFSPVAYDGDTHHFQSPGLKPENSSVYGFSGKKSFAPSKHAPIASATGKLAFGVAGASVAFSALSVYQGYQEGGLYGAANSASWELGISAATYRFAHFAGSGANMKFIQNPGIASTVSRGAGAALGSAAAGALGLGIPGNFIGAYVGASPTNALKAGFRHPVASGLAVTALAGYNAMRGLKKTLELGYQYKQSQRGIDTSGSLAAFSTQNATTMRARAVQAISKSHLNARSALGMEANFMHYPSRNYHSRYR